MDLNGLEEYDISADELLNGDGRGQEKPEGQKNFFLEILANGGMAQKKIAEEAEGRGIKEKRCGMPNGNLRLIL